MIAAAQHPGWVDVIPGAGPFKYQSKELDQDLDLLSGWL
jgi:hypothetical protein